MLSRAHGRLEKSAQNDPERFRLSLVVVLTVRPVLDAWAPAQAISKRGPWSTSGLVVVNRTISTCSVQRCASPRWKCGSSQVQDRQQIAGRGLTLDSLSIRLIVLEDVPAGACRRRRRA